MIAGATSASGSGIDQAKVNRSLATTFAHLYRMQTGQLHRPDVTDAQLQASATCGKGGSRVDDVGPGNDWRCVVKWHLPGSTATGSAIYQLDVTQTGATSPTVTDHSKSTASSRSAPRRVMCRIPCGSSTATSIC